MIIKYLNIEIFFDDIGSLKGYYTVIKRNRFIILNNNLDEYMKKLVCAHELGHDQLHKNIAQTTSMFHEVKLYGNNKLEYEANQFAAELLLPTNEFITLIEEGKNIERIAQELFVDPNLVGIKTCTLVQQGYNINIQDYNSSFLRK